jgi:tRNA-modifying protein YgfZ
MGAQVTLLPDRSLIEVAGEDRAGFLQGLITNDVEQLAESAACFAGFLSPQGKILFDFFVIRLGGAYLIDCPKNTAADLVKRLSFYKLRAKVSISDVSAAWAVVAVWGEGAGDLCRQDAATAYQDPRLSALGYRLLFDAQKSPSAVQSFSGYEAMRIGFGVPEGGKDYAFGDTFPHEACFDLLNGIDFKKGCYVGQEVVSRMQHRGTARTRVVCVLGRQPLPESGGDILAGGFTVGHLGSVAGNSGVALVRLDRVKDALAKGQGLTVADSPVELCAPDWASYSLDASSVGASQ